MGSCAGANTPDYLPIDSTISTSADCSYLPCALNEPYVMCVSDMFVLAGLLLVAQALHPTHAWGGLFNRFSPEMLSNLGYGGHGSFRAMPFLQVTSGFTQYKYYMIFIDSSALHLISNPSIYRTPPSINYHDVLYLIFHIRTYVGYSQYFSKATPCYCYWHNILQRHNIVIVSPSFGKLLF